MLLSPHFTCDEMTHSNTAITKHIDNTPTNKVVENLTKLCATVLENIRTAYGKPIHINSGYRSPELNKAVGGVPTSEHQYGMAADIDNGIAENKKIFALIVKMMKEKKLHVGQCIDEKSFSWVHVSIPSEKHSNEILHKC
jgi:zinc D-Ala-D-Ala carboxypeptidase